jgi:thiamine-phosphate pyrophosphorylase
VRLPDPPLLVVTDRHQTREPIETVVEAAFAGGCRWLSLREKDLAAPSREALLRRAVAIGRRFGATVMVHEDIEAAIAAQAGGIHLPSGVSPAAVRRRLGLQVLIGCSAHDARELEAASGADYATLSPVFPSASKPGYGPVLGIARFAATTAAARLPVIALGGVDASNIASCIDAGAAGVAVMGGVMAAMDVSAVMAGLIRTLSAALAVRGNGGHSGAPS